jgi:tetratricopeptide (TPR) repeat protein
MRTGTGLRKHFVYLIILIVIPVILFSNTFKNPFIWDDEELIFEDSYIKSLKSLPLLFSPTYWAHLRPGAKGEYRPTGIITFAIDYKLWGFNPAGYHLTNLAIYIMIILLIYALLGHLIKPGRKKKLPGAKWNYEGFFEIPFLTALIFATYPVHVESVTWIKNRTGLLAMLFMLLSMLFFVKYAQENKKTVFSRAYFFSLVFCALSLISHEISVSLPLLFLILSLCFIHRPRVLKRYLELFPFFFFTALFLCLKVFLLGNLVSSVNAPVNLGLFSHIFSVFKTYGHYMRILGFPFILKAEHGFKIPVYFWEPEVLLPAILLMILLVFSIRNIKRRNILSFSLLWTFTALLPASNIVPLTGRPIAEQRLLIPSLGYCLLLAFVLSKLFFYGSGKMKNIRRISAVVLAVFIFLSFSARTITRNRDWYDPLGFWIKTAEASLDNSRAHYNLGVAYLGGRNLLNAGFQPAKQDKAIKKATNCFLKALEINPLNFDAHNNLGNIYLFRGSPEKAVEHLKRAAEIKPLNSGILTNLGVAYEKTGNDKQAVSSYLSALNADPYNADAYNNLGMFYYKNKSIDKSISSFKKAIEIKPDDYTVYINLANALMVKGQIKQAARLYKKTLKADPENISALTNLGLLLTFSKRQKEALPLLIKALSSGRLNADSYFTVHKAFQSMDGNRMFLDKIKELGILSPDDPDIMAVTGNALLYEKQYGKAEDYLIKAIDIDPSNIRAITCLGDAYMEQDMTDKALTQYKKACRINPDDNRALDILADAYTAMGKDEKAYDLYMEALEKDSFRSGALYKIVEMLLRSEQYQKALDICLPLSEKYPENAYIYKQTGDIYMLMEKHKEAASSYSESLELEPDNFETAKALAEAYSLSGAMDRAEQLMLSIIKKFPGNIDLYYELAGIYNKQGKLREASDIYTKIIRSDPSHTKSLNNLGVIYGRTGDIVKAIELFSTAISIDPGYEDAYNNLGNAYMAVNKKNKAMETYEKLIALNPDYAPAYFNLGNIYNLSGDSIKAVGFYNNAVSKDPDYAKAHSALAVLYFNLRNYESSLYHFNRAKELGIVNKHLEAALEEYKKRNPFGY